MFTFTVPMPWLWDLAEEYRNILKESSFYKVVASASFPTDMRWVNQLYYLSGDFALAMALRYSGCHDLRFQSRFAEHAAEELEHPSMLLDWLYEHGFLKPGEDPNTIPPTLETIALGSYFIRSATSGSPAHQVITLNLVSEGSAYDFYSAVNPKLKELGLLTGPYWGLHEAADMGHRMVGLNLIPQCEKEDPLGQLYARTVWEVSTLIGQMLLSWSGIPSDQKYRLPFKGVLS